ncbi:hypothetical protein LWI28_017070 [Acer negundo]|uniref:CRAL-TRIO domain-containing protein n=1 Tax=Acer negundo TaxID=4023 RepID=A0AAD5JI08_ACENE|nr:hypothetical protein LWI28_017070 [Acer negundo]KAK4860156.1 hypothetical protein QYF36_018261 [Acer negundo]
MFRLWGSSHHDQEENDMLRPDSKVKELKVEIGSLSGRSVHYCTDACLKRYLEARNWNVDKAKKMLEETLKWRSTYRPEEIRWNEVALEGETGKLFRASFHDRQGRSVLIMRPGFQNTKSIEDQIRHLVYLIENAILNLPEGQEQMAWLIDFTGWSLSTSVPVKSARDTIHILQNHYPERLAIAFLYNPPRIFEAFWKVVKYFLDAKTFQKVKFVYPKNKDSVEVMRSYFDEENLPIEFGGKATLQYDHEEFSKLMVQDEGKSATLWGFDDKVQRVRIGHSGAEVAPEPVNIAPPASLLVCRVFGHHFRELNETRYESHDPGMFR